MTFTRHSGTAAIDLGRPPRATSPSLNIAREESEPRRKRYSAEIADAELAGIEMPEPAEFEARGRFYPNIHALEATTKDWIYENGLHRPKVDWTSLLNWNTSITIGPGSGPVHLNPYSTASFIHPVFSGANWGTSVFTPPAPALPLENREMPVIGYRSWKMMENFQLGFGTKPRLSSLNTGYGLWKKGSNQAVCRINGGHGRAADQHCHCGFYVLAEIDSAMAWAGGMSDDLIVGAVMGWGQVAQHGQEGWRAEFAQVIALLDCKFSATQLKNTERIAKAYGVGVFERGGLEAYVAEWGDPFGEAVSG